jgi:hypothetical protein
MQKRKFTASNRVYDSQIMGKIKRKNDVSVQALKWEPLIRE